MTTFQVYLGIETDVHPTDWRLDKKADNRFGDLLEDPGVGVLKRGTMLSRALPEKRSLLC